MMCKSVPRAGKPAESSSILKRRVLVWNGATEAAPIARAVSPRNTWQANGATV